MTTPSRQGKGKGMRGRTGGAAVDLEKFETCPIRVSVPLPRGIEGIMPCREFERFAQEATIKELERQADLAVKDKVRLQSILKRVRDAEAKMQAVKAEKAERVEKAPKRQASQARQGVRQGTQQGTAAKPADVGKLATQITTLSKQVAALPEEQQAHIAPALTSLAKTSREFKRAVGAAPEQVAAIVKQETSASRQRLVAENAALREENAVLREENAKLAQTAAECQAFVRGVETRHDPIREQMETLQAENFELARRNAFLEQQLAAASSATTRRSAGMGRAAQPTGMSSAQLKNLERRLALREAAADARAEKFDQLSSSFD